MRHRADTRGFLGRKDMKRFVFVTCALLVPMTTTAADSSAECLTNKYNQYAKAQEAWQRDFTKLIVEIAPRYEEVANIYMTDQLRAIERAKLAVAFFAREEPGKLRTQMSLNNWLNLDEADHSGLRRAMSAMGSCSSLTRPRASGPVTRTATACARCYGRTS